MRNVSRREFLAGIAGLSAAGVLAACGSQTAAPQADQKPAAGTGTTPAASSSPKEVKGILTFADADKADKEGALVWYGAEVEANQIQIFKEFNKLFPNINTSNYVRDQTGRAYAKLTTEEQAGQYMCDIFNSTDIAVSQDFQQKNGWVKYNSAYEKDFDPKFLSDPAGYFVWHGVDVVGIAYNTNLVKDSDAPKALKDLLDPKWKGAINFKDSASGWQGMQWLQLKKLYGDQYWKDMVNQQPKGLASVTQQYERLINGEDKIIGLAQYSTFLQNKEKGAPIAFVFPSDGVLVGPTTIGLVTKGSHPEASKLYVDWLLSPVGQAAFVKATYYHSPRKDVAPPPGGKNLSEMKVWVPDWPEYFATHDQWVKEWNALVGLK